MRATRFTRTLAPLIMLLLAAAVACASSPEAEDEPVERKAWDQEDMLGLSAQLAQSMREIRRTFRNEPVFRDQHSPNQHAVVRLEETLRQLERASGQLASRVADGGGFEETRASARRIGMLLNDADMWSRRVMSSAWLDERIRPAQELINRIAPYYGSGPLFDPETMERVDRAPNPDRRLPDSSEQPEPAE